MQQGEACSCVSESLKGLKGPVRKTGGHADCCATEERRHMAAIGVVPLTRLQVTELEEAVTELADFPNGLSAVSECFGLS